MKVCRLHAFILKMEGSVSVGLIVFGVDLNFARTILLSVIEAYNSPERILTMDNEGVASTCLYAQKGRLFFIRLNSFWSCFEF